jgi:hypothetical protein
MLAVGVVNLVTPKAAAKRELLCNRPASALNIVSESSRNIKIIMKIKRGRFLQVI